MTPATAILVGTQGRATEFRDPLLWEMVMTRLMFAGLIAVAAAMSAGVARAEDGCGPGCYAAPNGGCVVNGWQRGARVWNECPAGARPRPPCGRFYIWSSAARACIGR